MTRPGDNLKADTAAAYAAAADLFDHPALGFWDRFGRRTLDRIDLPPGGAVLDACCGTGASALPAAERVGPSGRVVGLDLSEPSLALARAKAEQRGLSNVEFLAHDVEATGFADGAFDAVVCVFGIFFLPDMVAGARELWRLVRPRGTLAVTIWGADLFDPASGLFWEAVHAERPDVEPFRPWTRLTSPEALAALFQRSGIPGAGVVAEPGRHPLAAPEDWWTIVLGSGYRAAVDAIGPEAAERVRTATLAALHAQQVREITADVVYGVAAKPGPPRPGPP